MKPCIKCNNKIWEYIKPYLKEWGYETESFNINFKLYPLLTINSFGTFGMFLSGEIFSYNKELLTDVEEFLEKAATLKGFVYKRKNIMKIHDIEIKPGMGIYISKQDYSHLYIVFPTKDGLGAIPYDRKGDWIVLSDILNKGKEEIVAICGLAERGVPIGHNILWEKQRKKVMITLDEIAKKFGYSVDQIDIKNK